MSYYFIIKEAVYNHGVFGPYESLDKAKSSFDDAYKKAAVDFSNGDFDGHHNYYIVKGLPKFTGEDADYNVALSCPYEPYEKCRDWKW